MLRVWVSAAINTLLSEVAGKAVADASLSERSKVQKIVHTA